MHVLLATYFFDNCLERASEWAHGLITSHAVVTKIWFLEEIRYHFISSRFVLSSVHSHPRIPAGDDVFIYLTTSFSFYLVSLFFVHGPLPGRVRMMILIYTYLLSADTGLSYQIPSILLSFPAHPLCNIKLRFPIFLPTPTLTQQTLSIYLISKSQSTLPYPTITHLISPYLLFLTGTLVRYSF